jgi:hypothetical protein
MAYIWSKGATSKFRLGLASIGWPWHHHLHLIYHVWAQTHCLTGGKHLGCYKFLNSINCIVRFISITSNFFFCFKDLHSHCSDTIFVTLNVCMCYLLSYSNKLQCFSSFWYELMFCQMTKISILFLKSTLLWMLLVMLPLVRANIFIIVIYPLFFLSVFCADPTWPLVQPLVV